MKQHILYRFALSTCFSLYVFVFSSFSLVLYFFFKCERRFLVRLSIFFFFQSLAFRVSPLVLVFPYGRGMLIVWAVKALEGDIKLK